LATVRGRKHVKKGGRMYLLHPKNERNVSAERQKNHPVGIQGKHRRVRSGEEGTTKWEDACDLVSTQTVFSGAAK